MFFILTIYPWISVFCVWTPGRFHPTGLLISINENDTAKFCHLSGSRGHNMEAFKAWKEYNFDIPHPQGSHRGCRQSSRWCSQMLQLRCRHCPRCRPQTSAPLLGSLLLGCHSWGTPPGGAVGEEHVKVLKLYSKGIVFSFCTYHKC